MLYISEGGRAWSSFKFKQESTFSRPSQLRPPETCPDHLGEYISIDFLEEDAHRLWRGKWLIGTLHNLKNSVTRENCKQLACHSGGRVYAAWFNILLLLDHARASGRGGEGNRAIVHNPLIADRLALTEEYHFANFTFTFITSSFSIERQGQRWLFKKVGKWIGIDSSGGTEKASLSACWWWDPFLWVRPRRGVSLY